LVEGFCRTPSHNPLRIYWCLNSLVADCRVGQAVRRTSGTERNPPDHRVEKDVVTQMDHVEGDKKGGADLGKRQLLETPMTTLARRKNSSNQQNGNIQTLH
jgi:hypothetical protein